MMGYMRPTFAQGKRAAISKLLELRRQAQKDKEPRVVLRIQGILMSLAGHTTGEIADHLKVHRSTVPLWIDQWNRYGKEGLLEGYRSGRPTGLSREDRDRLGDILDSGPVAYGLETGIWTSPLVRQIIEEEFGQRYHAGHVRKLLPAVGLLGATANDQAGSGRCEATPQMGALHVPESKKNAKTEGAVIVFEDEASFRQTPTLHATWAKRGSQPQIPTRGERNTQKIFGAVRLDNASFIYLHQEDYFQWETYLAFLEQVVVPAFYRRRHRIYLIQDNASYHKKQETYDWFKANRRYVEVFQLPPYWPELNATERIWNYTRKYVTHNRFFEQPQDLCDALFRRFDYVRHHPQEIEDLLHPFF